MQSLALKIRFAPVSMIAILCCLFAAYTFREFHSVDHAVIAAITHIRSDNPILNKTIYRGSELYLLTGGILVGLVWYFWFQDKNLQARHLLFTEIVAVLLTTILGPALQLYLPRRLRPIHDPTSGVLALPGIDPKILSNWGSFPSDHAVVFFALAAIIWRRSRPLGLLALASALFGTLPRVYMGFHYASDVFGGALIGVIFVSLFTRFAPQAPLRWGLSWETRWPGLFYGLAFIISFELATLFEDIRLAGNGFFTLLLQHGASDHL